MPQARVRPAWGSRSEGVRGEQELQNYEFRVRADILDRPAPNMPSNPDEAKTHAQTAGGRQGAL